MGQSELERVIKERIEELKQLEKSARHRSLAISYQDKRDELEALLIRVHGISAIQWVREAGCH
jgi:hypothetical protein